MTLLLLRGLARPAVERSPLRVDDQFPGGCGLPAPRPVLPTPHKLQAIFQEEQVRQYSQCTNRKLVNAAPQRWSGVATVLAVIVNRGAIDGMYTAENKDSPLTSISQEIDELYSIIKPAAEAIVMCQQTHVPTGTTAVLRMAALKLHTLKLHVPLDILSPARKLAQGGAAGVGGGERPASSTPREPSSLTAVARNTRELMLHAVNWRGFDKRYKDADSEKTDFLFDMQMKLHPSTANMEYVDTLANTPQRATAVKLAVKEKVIALAVKLAEAAAAAKEEAANTTPEPAAKRARQAAAPIFPVTPSAANKSAEATARLYASLGLFSMGGAGADDEPPSFEETARQELTKLEAVKAGLSCDNPLVWWKTWGDSYPLLGRAARVVFGAPASSAVLERDFSDAGRMMTSSRSTMDSKYVEIILFLHGNLDFIPQDIPKVSAEAAQEKIPGRLVNPVDGLEQLDGAFVAPVDVTDGEEGASA